MASLSARQDALAAIVVVLGVSMLIAPLPPLVLDVMVALSLFSATLIMLGATYAPSMLAFSSLPTVLLITTMFRLSLEVAITRQVLLEAHAGEIVLAFGEFVVGGNLAVGLVVFIILTVVNFLVVTKGSERVAEVGARFSLDAMPGRQMAIDAEMRAGAISAAEAAERRLELSRASEMHGSMDGAMKFVKGDAIAAIVILMVNLIGGLVVGVQLHGMSLAESARVYSVLSVGEGLVAQIPSLMISVAAGLLITRGEGGEAGGGQGASRIIIRQLLASRHALLMTGVVMLVFAAIPGIPALPFALLAAITLGAVGHAYRKAARQAREAAAADGGADRPTDTVVFDAARPYALELTAGAAGVADARAFEDAVRTLRNGIVDKGYMVPVLTVNHLADPSLDGIRVRFLVSEVCFVDVRIAPGEIVEDFDKDGDTAAPGAGERRRILRGGEWLWVRPALADGEPVPKGAQYLAARAATAIEDVIWATSSRFISVREAQRMLYWAERNNHELHEESKRLLSLAKLTQVIQRLAAERVAVRNGFVILDTLCQWAERERDVELLTEQVRIALRLEICQQLAPDGELSVILVSPQAEDTLRRATRTSSAGTYLALEPSAVEDLVASVREALQFARGRVSPVALVAPQEIRAVLRRTLSEAFPTLPVLSYAELTNQLEVAPLTEVGFEPARAPFGADASVGREAFGATVR